MLGSRQSIAGAIQWVRRAALLDLRRPPGSYKRRMLLGPGDMLRVPNGCPGLCKVWISSVGFVHRPPGKCLGAFSGAPCECISVGTQEMEPG